jgi:serine/threonine-protein kinase
MDAARWKRMREIVQAVSEAPLTERDQVLRDACGSDIALYDDVRSLLRPAHDTPELLERVVADAVASLADGPVEGMVVGPYRIVREIGHGGMGAVYLAERVDGQFEQRVALKLIKPQLTAAEFLRRFRAERQILARLQHPNIARLLDGGIDGAGRPYFALEFVEGDPIDRYCATHGLDIDGRLALFLEACRAVSYAHASLVVHRDLKPAHIMVAPDRQVRLLDFGIAKMLGDDAHAGTLTDLGVRALTPEYASPEQVRGEPVDTASDVYSLGVILYELLTGTRPYDVEGRTPAEVERIVCGVMPDKPSTRLTGTRRAADHRTETSRRRLRRDLDVICMKALQKDPARRYASVEAFAEDIRRNLEGRPVLARPDSLAYRSRCFVARHRVGVAMVAASVVTLATLLTMHTVRLARERDRAQFEAAKAEQVSSFLRGLFEVSDPSAARGRTITARELLDEGAARIERELASQPDVRAVMMRVIGDVYGSLGLYDEALPLLERALADHRRIHGAVHEETATSALALAVLLQDRGDVAAAEPLFREALATRRQLYGEAHEKVSETLRDLAFLVETRGDPTTAEALLRQALAMDRQLVAADHPRVVKATAELAGLLRRQLRLEEAEPVLRAALDAQRRQLGRRDLAVASTVRNLASLLRDRGALDEADALYREVIDIRREILGDLHPEVAIALNSHALLLDRRQDHAGAADAYRGAIRILEHVHAGQPHPDLAATYNNLAGTLRALGQLDDAAAMFTKSLQIVDRVLDAGHPNRAFARIGLAGIYIDQGNFARAEPLIREALALRRAGLAAGHRYIGDALVTLGQCLTGLARYGEAEKALLEGQAVFRAAADEARTARARRTLDALYVAWGKPDRAGGMRPAMRPAS